MLNKLYFVSMQMKFLLITWCIIDLGIATFSDACLINFIGLLPNVVHIFFYLFWNTFISIAWRFQNTSCGQKFIMPCMWLEDGTLLNSLLNFYCIKIIDWYSANHRAACIFPWGDTIFYFGRNDVYTPAIAVSYFHCKI